MRKTIKVGAVVVHYKNSKDTLRCLSSVMDLDFPSPEVVVVDNSSNFSESSDNKSVLVIHPSKNLGFGGGVNKGLQFLLKKGFDFALVLNNDVIVHPNLLKKLLKPFKKNSTIAATGPVITYRINGKEKTWFGGGYFNETFVFTRHHHINKPRGHYHTGPTDYITGACLLINMQTISEVGYFDENYFMYMEDVDWCYRARRQGLICWLVGEPLVEHEVSSSAGVRGSNTLTPFQAYYYARNGFLFAFKHRHGPALLPALIGQFTIRFFQYARPLVAHQNWVGLRAYIAGLFAGLTFRFGPSWTKDKHNG